MPYTSHDMVIAAKVFSLCFVGMIQHYGPSFCELVLTLLVKEPGHDFFFTLN